MDNQGEMEKTRTAEEILDELVSLEDKIGYHPEQFDYLSRVLDLIHEWKDQRSKDLRDMDEEDKKAA